MVLGKLPIEIKCNMAREQRNPEWTIDELREALLKEIKILEQGQFTSMDSFPSDTAITTSFFTGTRSKHHSRDHRGTSFSPVKKLVCTYCKGAHTANNCNVVTDPDKRLEIVKKERLCFNCLALHKVSECKSKQSCKTCKRRHHSSLCHASFSGGKDNSSGSTDTNQNGTATAKNTLQVVQGSEGTSFTHVGTIHNVNLPVTCLLKTAIATVSAGDRYTRANILFDEGAQRSFISQKLADQLQLCPHSIENINISSFGAESAIS